MPSGNHDQRSLVLGRTVAARLRAAPDLVSQARCTLERWVSLPDNSPSQTAACLEWSPLLDRLSAEEVADLLASDTPQAARLRQNSPFAGVLGPREVWSVKRSLPPCSAAILMPI